MTPRTSPRAGTESKDREIIELLEQLEKRTHPKPQALCIVWQIVCKIILVAKQQNTNAKELIESRKRGKRGRGKIEDGREGESLEGNYVGVCCLTLLRPPFFGLFEKKKN